MSNVLILRVICGCVAVFGLFSVIGCGTSNESEESVQSKSRSSNEARSVAGPTDDQISDGDRSSPEQLNTETQLRHIQNERKQLDREVWSEEIAAQTYEQFFVSLWDELRVAKVPLNVLANVAFDRLTYPVPVDAENLELGIRRFVLSDQLQR